MQITGYWYPEGSSARYDATMQCSGEDYLLTIVNSEDDSGKLKTLRISNRVGNIPRRLTLKNQSVFVTKNNDAIDRLIETSNHKDGTWHFLHILETHKRWITTAFILMLMISFVSVRWGLPWLSKEFAYAMPISMSEKISSGSFELLDETVLQPSKLSEDRQNKMRRHFKNVLLSTQTEGFNYKLYFRRLDDIPNAFALPSGDVVITDALIELAGNQQEIDSVLLHEIGHVVHRHGLQQIIHSSIVAVGATLLVGDAAGVQEMIVALPVFLLESQYSRANEAEADEYAFEQMVALGIDPLYFSTMFEKMTQSENQEKESADLSNGSSTESPPSDTLEKYGEFISTHPSSPHRMQRAREYSEKYFK